MIMAYRLAGFFAAHGVWSIGDKGPVIPMYAYTLENNEMNMLRLVTEEYETAVMAGKQRLEQNKEDANDAVLIYDGFITIGEKKYDALIIDIRSHFSPASKAQMVIPYTPEKEGLPISIHKPKISIWENCEDFDMNDCINIFFEGVDSHQEGAAFWNKHIDQSV